MITDHLSRHTRLARPSVPREADEMRVLVQWLEWARLDYCHVRNEGTTHRAHGVKSGVPDVLIFTVPPRLSLSGYPYRGVAIELKRTSGSTTSDAQKEWIAKLRADGWFAEVCLGADAAIKVLEGLGFKLGGQQKGA